MVNLKSTNPKSHEFGQILENFRLGTAQLRQLGELMQARKDSAEAMWNNPLLRPVKKLQGVAHKLLPTKVKNAKATAIAEGMGEEVR